MDHLHRIKKLQHSVSEKRIDALIVTHPANILYLCGFTGSSAVLIVTQNQAVFFSDSRYRAQSANEVQAARIVIGAKPGLSLAALWLARNRKPLKLMSCAIESEHMTISGRQRLKDMVGPGTRLRETSNLVERLRIIKDVDEITRLRQAAALGSSLWERLLKVIRPSMPESEVAGEIEYFARKKGASGMSFSTIIASGKRSALPHGNASPFPIAPKGFVVCDFGVILASYCSDMTRTLHVGRATGDARGTYDAVSEALQAGVEAVGPGVTTGEVDRAARSVLAKRGLAKYFSHSTGHGVGLEIHEAPRVAAKGGDILAPGMVITIEPGVYLPDQWGVRIEDMVLVTESGREVLTPVSRKLIQI